MKKKKISKGKLFLQWIPIAAIFLFFMIGLRYREDFSLDFLLSQAPRQVIPAIAFLMLLFSLKSLSIVFPILVIYALSGVLFPPAAAILINLCGTAVVLSIPYWLGRLSGVELVQSIFRKYPKARKLREFQRHNPWFFSFFLRVLGFLPGDVVSMYLGASRLPWLPSLIGGMAGMFPALLAGTFLGDNITDPTSPAFLVSAGGMILLSLLSVLLYRRYGKHSKKQMENRKDENHDSP
ncbi:MAG: TVP38/TMEM64 family protein [Candidatus Merdivicinus sp.]